jgi:hypothetical protein
LAFFWKEIAMSFPLQVSFKMLRWHPQLFATSAEGNTVSTMHRIKGGGIFGDFGIFSGAVDGGTPQFTLNFRKGDGFNHSYVITDATGHDLIRVPFQVAIVAQKIPFEIHLLGTRLEVHHETAARDTGASVLETLGSTWFDKELFDTFASPLYSIRREGGRPMIKVTNNRRYWRNRYLFEPGDALDPKILQLALPLAFTTSFLLKMLLVR